MDWLLSGIVVVLLVVGYLIFRSRADVSGSEARQLVDAGAVLLDVRTPQEFSGGHIEGAINIPVQELHHRLADVGAHDRAVVVYCRSGMRSARASAMLKEAGFSAVRDLGGIGRW
ncbi:MAG: rhodanese-like domain-containing protein [Deltaproteobacteria bacterium]|nr:rhodanese-like domain-containing protein [Nannocystaceae bacterium]